MQHDILIVDDEADIREQLCGVLSDEGFATHTAVMQMKLWHSYLPARPI